MGHSTNDVILQNTSTVKNPWHSIKDASTTALNLTQRLLAIRRLQYLHAAA